MDPSFGNNLDFSFDGYLSRISGLKYSPWIGRGYRDASKRILIVPESIYDWQQGSSVSAESLWKAHLVRQNVHEIGLHFTIENNYAGAESQRMYRNIERLMWSAKEVSPDQKLRLWRSVAFHEYVQRPMANLQERPSAEDFKRGACLLSQLMKILKPDLCVFLGTDVQKWKALESEFGKGPPWALQKINGTYPKIVPTAIDGKFCDIVMIKHPSERFSWNLWSQYLTDNSSGILQEFRG